MKVCNVCKKQNPLDNFYKDKTRKDGLDHKCKLCCKNKNKKWAEKNNERVKENCKKWREENREYVNAKMREWKKENPDKVYKVNKKYTDSNREKIKEDLKKRKQSDLLFRFSTNVRANIKNSFKRGTNQFRKDARTETILGCTIEEFRVHIENQFKEGMTFENYGEWHLDHIKPISLATTKEEVKDLCHYKNYQPLWAKENLLKSNKY